MFLFTQIRTASGCSVVTAAPHGKCTTGGAFDQKTTAIQMCVQMLGCWLFLALSAHCDYYHTVSAMSPTTDKPIC